MHLTITRNDGGGLDFIGDDGAEVHDLEGLYLCDRDYSEIHAIAAELKSAGHTISATPDAAKQIKRLTRAEIV